MDYKKYSLYTSEKALKKKCLNYAFACRGTRFVMDYKKYSFDASEKALKKKYLNYAFACRGTRLAGAARFELTNAAVKVLCLTA